MEVKVILIPSPDIQRGVCKLLKYLVKSSGSQSVVSRPTASSSPGNVLERPILGVHPRPTESRTPETGPRNRCFNKPSR